VYKIFGLIFIASVIFVKFPAAGFEDRKDSFTYVGSKVCKECHGEDAIGNQYKIWAMSPHARAYKTLLGEKASEIAGKKNITSPEKSYECLQCHATGKGRVESIVKEGVGCESCHGPGSEYHKASNHVDYNSRENGYRRAIRFGMYPIRGIGSLKRRERLCLSCHTKERPCFPENPSSIYEFRIPIQTIDSLWKGDVNFRHPLRK
jgi:hypothetical protein